MEHIVNFDVGRLLQEFLKNYAHFHPGKRGPGAGVLAASEGDVFLDFRTVEDEVCGRLPALRVAVGSGKAKEDLGACLDRPAADGRIAPRQPGGLLG